MLFAMIWINYQTRWLAALIFLVIFLSFIPLGLQQILKTRNDQFLPFHFLFIVHKRFYRLKMQWSDPVKRLWKAFIFQFDSFL